MTTEIKWGDLKEWDPNDRQMVLDSLRLGLPVVHCKFCNGPTNMTGTQMCDRCWELHHRIYSDKALTVKIVESLGGKLTWPSKSSQEAKQEQTKEASKQEKP